jgi:hypothetical protein
MRSAHGAVLTSPAGQIRTRVRYCGISTDRQILSSKLHGEALLRADRPEVRALIAELAEIAHGSDDIRTEAAGTPAGAWFASPATAYAEKLVAAGLLLLAGPVEGDQITEWVRVGFQRRRQASATYDPGR